MVRAEARRRGDFGHDSTTQASIRTCNQEGALHVRHSRCVVVILDPQKLVLESLCKGILNKKGMCGGRAMQRLCDTGLASFVF